MLIQLVEKIPIKTVGTEIMLIRAILNTILTLLILGGLAHAEEAETSAQVDNQVKELSGISIIGSKE